MRSSILCAMLLLVLGVSGCSLSGEKPEPQGKMRDVLEVPPDLVRPPRGDLSVDVPGGVVAPAAASSAASSSAAASFNKSSVAPQKSEQTAGGVPATVAGKPVVRIERDGNQRWLVVPGQPDAVTVHVRNYLASRNFNLEVDNPKAGIFETEWQERKVKLGTNALTRAISSLQSTGLRDKFRIRIEPGRATDTSEVYVSHQGLEQVLTSTAGGVGGGPESTWQPRATDYQAEAELLSALMTSFGMSEQAAKDNVGKVAAAGARKTKDGLLLQQQDMDSAWRRVGQALDRSSFVVEDRDRHQGIFYVYDQSITGADKKGNLFGGWLTFGENKDAYEDRFQVTLKTVDGGTSLKVLNVKGERPESRSGERLLEYLQQQLQ